MAGYADEYSLDEDFRLEAEYLYELIKRPGWKNRIVQTRDYAGDGRYRVKISIDIKTDDLESRRIALVPNVSASHSDRGEGFSTASPVVQGADAAGVGYAPAYIPYGFIDKRRAIFEFDAKDAAGSSIKLMPRADTKLVICTILLGCLSRYRSMQERHKQEIVFKERLDKQYPGLFPEVDIRLPSQRMLDIFGHYYEETLHFEDADSLVEAMKDDFNRMVAEEGVPESASEKDAWEAIEALYEFKELLLLFANEWLYVLLVDPCDDANLGIVKVSYTYSTNLVPGESGAGERRTELMKRLLLSVAIGVPLGYSPALGLGIWWVGVLCATVVGVLVFALVSKEVVRGFGSFRGLDIEYDMNLIGSAETEHYVISAPPGTVYSPYPASIKRALCDKARLLHFNRGSWRFPEPRIAVFDYANASPVQVGDLLDEDCCHATGSYALTTESIALRTEKTWNEIDPDLVLCGADRERNEDWPGRRYRKIAYDKSESHDYRLTVKLRPRSGKRSIGYALAPLVSMLSIALMSFCPPDSNAIPVLASVIPMLSLALTVSEKESFSRKTLLMLPRAIWKISIAITVVAIPLFFLVPDMLPAHELSEAYVCLYFGSEIWRRFSFSSMAVLLVGAVINVLWYAYHNIQDAWSLSPDAFDEMPLRFIKGRRASAQ